MSITSVGHACSVTSWVYLDAQKRRKTGCLWLLIAFFTWPFGVAAYAFLRDKTIQL
jgi:hypothetical protein